MYLLSVNAMLVMLAGAPASSDGATLDVITLRIIEDKLASDNAIAIKCAIRNNSDKTVFIHKTLSLLRIYYRQASGHSEGAPVVSGRQRPLHIVAKDIIAIEPTREVIVELTVEPRDGKPAIKIESQLLYGYDRSDFVASAVDHLNKARDVTVWEFRKDNNR